MELADKINILISTLNNLKDAEGILKKIVDKMIITINSKNKIITAGNGGSACDALHFSGELVGKLDYDRMPYASICINADISNLTCISNDYGYVNVFERQIRAIGKKGDLFIAFSTSGKSENILRALATCDEMEISSVFITGNAVNANLNPSCLTLNIPASETATIQECQTLITHYLISQFQRLIR